MTFSTRKFWFWVGLSVAFIYFLYLINSILLPFVVGMMAAYFLDPAADWLESRKCSRNVAASIITLVFFGVVITLVTTLSPILYDQLSGLMRAVPGYMEQLRMTAEPYVERLLGLFTAYPKAEADEALNNASFSAFEVAKQFVVRLFSSGMAMLNLMMLLFLTPVVTFYLLRDWDRMINRINELLPREYAATIREQARKVDETIASYLRGQVNVCLLLCVYYVLALAFFVHLKYAVLVGVLAGLISFIPFIGAVTSLGVALGVAYFQPGGDVMMVKVLVVFAIGLFLENNILIPRIIGGKVALHPAWMIFGILAGGALLGFVGVLLAVPLTAVIGVLGRFAVEQYQSSEMFKGEKGRGKGKKVPTA